MAKGERMSQDAGLTRHGIRYRTLREQGLCENCKAPSPVHSRCDECREKRNRLAKKKLNPTMAQKVARHEYNRKRYWALKSQGRCTYCKRANSSGRAKCDTCRQYQYIQASVRYHRRKDAGLCPICEQPYSGDYVHCEMCRAARRKSKEVAT